MVDKERIELSSLGCKPSILPLNDSPTRKFGRCAGLETYYVDDRRVSDDASFYVLPVRLTILIWTVMPASYRYTGQVLVPLISVSIHAAIYERDNTSK